MSSKQIFNIGTTVFYQGDDINQEGYGKITDQLDDYLGEVQMVITLEDGRVITDVTPADFEAPRVLGESGVPEFQMVDTWESEVENWKDLVEDEGGYREENSAWLYSL